MQIDQKVAPPRGGEMSQFCDFLLFRSLIRPTGCKYGPTHTPNGSKDVFRLIHVPFQGLGVFILAIEADRLGLDILGLSETMLEGQGERRLERGQLLLRSGRQSKAN